VDRPRHRLDLTNVAIPVHAVGIQPAVVEECQQAQFQIPLAQQPCFVLTQALYAGRVRCRNRMNKIVSNGGQCMRPVVPWSGRISCVDKVSQDSRHLTGDAEVPQQTPEAT
jgi:hypothetical protein